MNLAEQHLMTGVWALNALEDSESAAFEQHLRECESCRTEAVEMRETAACLSALIEVMPPPYLRERVLAAASTTRQQPPESPRVAQLRPRRPWLRRAAVFAAAASLLGAVGIGVQSTLQLSGEVADLRQVAARYEQLNSLMSAPNAKIVSRELPAGGSGIAVFSPDHGKVAFVATGLPALPANRTYQLWLEDGSGLHPAGLLGGAGDPMVMALHDGTQRIALTVEPRGGSATPSTDPVVSLPYA
ncbi:anti-sigma factor domain-containing protein [Lentzea sp. NPDC051213]|uniref:anti-sigma factor n=1 Tax=Lentzea sp. NPDC051213 TaxID=3364126 RepID=UPI00379AEA6C